MFDGCRAFEDLRPHVRSHRREVGKVDDADTRPTSLDPGLTVPGVGPDSYTLSHTPTPTPRRDWGPDPSEVPDTSRSLPVHEGRRECRQGDWTLVRFYLSPKARYSTSRQWVEARVKECQRNFPVSVRYAPHSTSCLPRRSDWSGPDPEVSQWIGGRVGSGKWDLSGHHREDSPVK